MGATTSEKHDRCFRCGREQRGQPSGVRCHECEEEYRHRRPGRVMCQLAATSCACVGVVLVIGVLAFATAGAALAVAPLIFFSTIPTVLLHLEARARRKFLSERIRPALPRAVALDR